MYLRNKKLWWKLINNEKLCKFYTCILSCNTTEDTFTPGGCWTLSILLLGKPFLLPIVCCFAVLFSRSFVGIFLTMYRIMKCFRKSLLLLLFVSHLFIRYYTVIIWSQNNWQEMRHYFELSENLFKFGFTCDSDIFVRHADTDIMSSLPICDRVRPHL